VASIRSTADLAKCATLTIRYHVRVAHDVDVVGGRRAATDRECHGIVRVLARDDLDAGRVVCPRLPPLGIGIQQSLLVASTPGNWHSATITCGFHPWELAFGEQEREMQVPLTAKSSSLN
jgi:hypothetical protein